MKKKKCHTLMKEKNIKVSVIKNLNKKPIDFEIF